MSSYNNSNVPLPYQPGQGHGGQVPPSSLQQYTPYAMQGAATYAGASAPPAPGSAHGGYYGQPQGFPSNPSTSMPMPGQHGPSPVYPQYTPENPPPPAVVAQWFAEVDVSHSGGISARSVHAALLSRVPYLSSVQFRDDHMRILVNMFDVQRTGRINSNQLIAMSGYLAQWARLFRGFDTDQSGYMDSSELGAAMQRFGITLRPNMITLLAERFGSSNGRSQHLSLADFISCCVVVRNLVDGFKARDLKMDDTAVFTYFDFLEFCLRCM